MKTILIAIVLICIAVIAKAQTDSLNAPIQFTGVVYTDTTMSVQELYRNAKRWFGRAFNSGKDVIQIDEKDATELTGRGYRELSYEGVQRAGKMWVQINIYFKPGKYKYVITDFTHEGTGSQGWPDFGLITYSNTPPEQVFMLFKKVGWSWLQSEADRLGNDLVISLKKQMSAPSPSDNW